MRCAIVSLMLALSFTTPAAGQSVPQPSPAIEPQQVVQFQLDGLRRGDAIGVATVWTFSHPENKRVTGPFPRFVEMIRRAPYNSLLGHRASQIEEVSRSDGQAVYDVTVTGRDGEVVVYRWIVSKVESGDQQGAWMTSVVSQPIPLGRAI
jgi:hypothetical protein